MLMLKLLDLLYLDGYRSLLSKYSDKFRDDFRDERHWVLDNYRLYMGAMFRQHDFRGMLALRKAHAQEDFITQYQLMAAFDGEESAQRWLENAGR